MHTLSKALPARAAMLLMAALLLIAFAVPASALADDPPMFPWHGYTLGVTLATDDAATVNYRSDKFQPNARFVLVKVSGIGGMIALSDIQAYTDEFVLRDVNKAEYECVSWSVGGLVKTEGFPKMADEQEWFGLIFCVPTKTPVEGFTLLVATEVANERIIVGLDKVNQDPNAE